MPSYYKYYRLRRKGATPGNWVHLFSHQPPTEALRGYAVRAGALAGQDLSDPALWDVQQLEPDTCAYCGTKHPAMTAFYNGKGDRVWVGTLSQACREQAVRDGYTYAAGVEVMGR